MEGLMDGLILYDISGLVDEIGILTKRAMLFCELNWERIWYQTLDKSTGNAALFLDQMKAETKHVINF